MGTFFTPDKKAHFCELIASTEPCYSQAEACRAIGINRQTLWLAKKDDPEFLEHFLAAERERDEALENAARKRAMAKSDLLAIFLLKGAFPDKYNPINRVEMSGHLATSDMSDDEIRAELAIMAGHVAPRAASDEPEDDNSDLV